MKVAVRTDGYPDSNYIKSQSRLLGETAGNVIAE